MGTFLAYIPQLIGAIVILIVGYLIARALQAVVSRLLQAIGFDGWMERGVMGRREQLVGELPSEGRTLEVIN